MLIRVSIYTLYINIKIPQVTVAYLLNKMSIRISAINMLIKDVTLGLSISTKISTIYLQYVSDVGVVVCDLSSGGAGRAGGQ